MDPAEAVQALIDCSAEIALAHHHGTFQLTDEPIDAPLLALAEALIAAGIAPRRFTALRPGKCANSDLLRSAELNRGRGLRRRVPP